MRWKIASLKTKDSWFSFSPSEVELSRCLNHQASSSHQAASTDFLHGLTSSWINNSSLHVTAERSLSASRLILRDLHSRLSFDSSVINYVGQFQSMTMILITNGGWMSNEVNSHSSWDNINHNLFIDSFPCDLNMFHSSFSRQHRRRGFRLLRKHSWKLNKIPRWISKQHDENNKQWKIDFLFWQFNWLTDCLACPASNINVNEAQRQFA